MAPHGFRADVDNASMFAGSLEEPAHVPLHPHMRESQGDEEWLAAVSLINSANRKVRKIDHTLRRAMEELSKSGAVGLGAEVG